MVDNSLQVAEAKIAAQSNNPWEQGRKQEA
jgi:hypothetical protein